MRVVSKKWFEAKVQVDGTAQDDGTHEFIVDAVSFTEAEARLLRFVAKTIGGTVDVRRLRPAKFSVVAYSEGHPSGWYKVKVVMIVEDEKSGREKETAYPVVVQAETIEDSISMAKAVMAGLMADCRIDKSERLDLEAVIEK